MAEQTQTQLTEAQAIHVVEQGVRREVRKDSERTLDYCKDAVKLQGHNVRKLAQKAQARAELAREDAEAKGLEVPAGFNADSYQSNVSNASGVMALFEYNIDAFETWLKTAESKSLSKIFKLFRELFTEAKPPKAKADGEAGDDSAGEDKTETPQVDVVIAALAFLTPEERQMVVEACFLLGVAETEAAEEPVAA